MCRFPGEVSDGGNVASFLDAAEPVMKWGGRALLVAGVAASIWDVASAPPAQKVHTAIHDSGSLVGGIIGSGVGGMVADGAEKTFNTVAGWF
jgi:hypothetical protein